MTSVGVWLDKGTCVFSPLFFFSNNCFSLIFLGHDGIAKRGQTEASLLKNGGKRAKLKKEGQTRN
jgi:hypothetical protein